MKIYIDLDGTLYNTSDFYDDVLNLLSDYGITKLEIKSIYPNDLNMNLDKIILRLSELHNFDQGFVARYNNLFNIDRVFDDVIPFLEEMSKNFELILLTRGNKDYQQHKISSTKLEKCFSQIIITESSKELLDIDYQNGIFIDNNPNELEKIYSKSAKCLIRIRRKEDKHYYQIDTKLDGLIYEFNCFDQKLTETILEYKNNK